MTRTHSARTFLLTLACILALGTVLPGVALAVSSYMLDITPGEMQNNFNVPRFELTNTSSSGEQIVGFSITIGDSNDYFYDFVASPDSNPLGEKDHHASEGITGATLVVGDRVNDRSGSASLVWSFGDFQAGEALVFQADIDPYASVSGIHQSADARLAWIDNGAMPNATFHVTFSDGSIAQEVFGDSQGDLPTSFHFAESGVGGSVQPVEGSPNAPAQPVPEPTAALLFGIGIATVATRRSRTPRDGDPDRLRGDRAAWRVLRFRSGRG